MNEQLTHGKTLQGVVTSNKMDKTITVRVTRKVKHPLYGKIITRFTKLHAHDPENQCLEGDWVVIQESKPMSKTKNWVLVERLEKLG
jgi:small subunit ribosomal protein S17